MEEKDKKGWWCCTSCDYEGPESEFQSRPDYKSCPKCRTGYVYSLEIGPAWSCAACGYKGAEIGFDEKFKCHICPNSKCESEDVFLDCDWQRLVDAENKAAAEEEEKQKRDRYEDFDDD